MLRAIIAVVSVALTIYALADCLQTEDRAVRGLPRWAWVVLIVLLPWVGPLTWLLAGHDRNGGSGGRPPRRSGPLAPDEDPEFLRRLDDDIRRERRERMRRESESGDAGRAGGIEDGPAGDVPEEGPR